MCKIASLCVQQLRLCSTVINIQTQTDGIVTSLYEKLDQLG